jgi:hypothetical protein
MKMSSQNQSLFMALLLALARRFRGYSFGSHAIILQVPFVHSSAKFLDDGFCLAPIGPALHLVKQFTDEKFIA